MRFGELSNTLQVVGDYRIIATIGKGGMGAVYSAVSSRDPRHEVAVKVVLPGSRFQASDFISFQKESALLSALSHPNVVAFYEFGLLDHAAGYYLIMERLNGKNLKQVISGQKHQLGFFFQIANQMASALDYVHSKGIIHQDIKPQNLMLERSPAGPGEYLLKILDFGIASASLIVSHTGQEEMDGAASRRWAGTPSYMAPEQSGELPYEPDHRSDLYATGCVLYEVLSGKTLFPTRDRKKLRRLHAYSEPTPLERLRPDIPMVVTQIVHRLLAKNPDDRYQSAFSLYADLLRAQTILSRDQATDASFGLGRYDTFLPGEVMATPDQGKQPVDQLLDAAWADSSRPCVVVIDGQPGCGKSRLLATLRQELRDRGMPFLGGSFAAQRIGVPLYTIASAFNEFLSTFSPQKERRRALKQYLHENLSDNQARKLAQLLPALVPLLELDRFLSRPVRLAELNSTILMDSFAVLANGFEHVDQPFALIFDDLQEADSLSLAILQQLFDAKDSGRFFVFATRQGSLPPSLANLDPVSRLHRLSVESFTDAKVEELVRMLLGVKQAVHADLMGFLRRRARGNPQLLVEYLRKLILLDLVRIDVEEIHSSPELSTYPLRLLTIDAVLNQLNQLSPASREVLEMCSLFSSKFYTGMLPVERSQTRSGSILALEVLRGAGIIQELGSSDVSMNLGRLFRFTHYRIKESIYEALSLEQRGSLHLKLARHLWSNLQQLDGEQLLVLARQFNEAILYCATSATPQDYQHGLSANLQAVKFCKQDGKPHVVIELYLQAAWKMADGVSLPIYHRDVRWLAQEWAQLAWDQAQYTEAAKRFLYVLTSLEESEIDRKMDLTVKVVESFIQAGALDQAASLISFELGGLKRDQRKLSSKMRIWWHLAVEGLQLRDGGHVRTIWRYLSTPGELTRQRNSRAEWEAELSELGLLVGVHYDVWAGLAWEQRAIASVATCDLKMETVLRLTISRASVLGYLDFIKPAYRLFDLAMDVAQQRQDPKLVGYGSLMKAFVLDYPRGRHSDCAISLQAAHDSFERDRHSFYYNHSVLFLAFQKLAMAQFSDALSCADEIGGRLPVTHPLRSRALALAMFAMFLQGRRAEISEIELEPSSDTCPTAQLFDRVCEVLHSFVRGDATTARRAFQTLACQFAESSAHRFLFCHEEDLVGIFLFSFPAVFELEQGRALMRTHEMRGILRLICRKVLRGKSYQRDSCLLLKARAYDWMSYNRADSLYTRSIQKAQLSGRILIRAFALMWQGLLAKRHGRPWQQTVLRAWDVANTHQINSIERILTRAMGGDVQLHNHVSGTAKLHHLKHHFAAHPTGLALTHGMLVSGALSGDGSEPISLERSLDLLKEHYRAAGAHCLIRKVNRKEAIWHHGYSDAAAPEVLQQYCQLYEELPAVIFLPLSDLAWYSHGSRNRDRLFGGLDSTVGSSISTADSLAGAQTYGMLTTDGSSNTIHGRLCAVIPVGLGGRQELRGIVILENIAGSFRQKLHSCRAELDLFANQFCRLAEKNLGSSQRFRRASDAKRNKTVTAPAPDKKLAGSTDFVDRIELCPWLDIHVPVFPRQDLVSHLFGRRLGNDRFALLYLQSPSAAARGFRQICALLALQVDSLAQVELEKPVEPHQIAGDLLHLIRQTPRLNLHLGFMLTLLVFDRAQSSLCGFHLGKVGATVLGSRQKIVPADEPGLLSADWEPLAFLSTDSTLVDGQVCVVGPSIDSLEEDMHGVQTSEVVQKSRLDGIGPDHFKIVYNGGGFDQVAKSS